MLALLDIGVGPGAPYRGYAFLPITVFPWRSPLEDHALRQQRAKHHVNQRMNGGFIGSIGHTPLIRPGRLSAGRY